MSFHLKLPFSSSCTFCSRILVIFFLLVVLDSIIIRRAILSADSLAINELTRFQMPCILLLNDILPLMRERSLNMNTYTRVDGDTDWNTDIHENIYIKRNDAVRKCFFLLIIANLWFLIRFHFVSVVFLPFFLCVNCGNFLIFWRIKEIIHLNHFVDSFKVHQWCKCSTESSYKSVALQMNSFFNGLCIYKFWSIILVLFFA